MRVTEQKQIQKETISNYWNKRSKSFAELRQEEIESPMGALWLKEITRNIESGKKLKILDVGTGTGFFPILLSKMGHEVTGVDFSPEMIEEARQLSQKYNVDADFYIMDAENLVFPDDTFDMVLSRNLTWTLTNPEKAYSQWIRVLKKGGILLNFDAEYSKESFSHTAKLLPKEHAHNKMDEGMLEECDAINKMLPLRHENRPDWDVTVLTTLGCTEITIDQHVSERIYSEINNFYNPTPMFSIKALKSGN